MRANGAKAALNISHIAHPTREFETPSGKIEFYSARAEEAGLPPLPVQQDSAQSDGSYPLRLCQGRTLTQFHASYDHGRALPTLAKRDPGPELWISPGDGAARGLGDGDALRVFNEQGAFEAKAHITADIPPGVVWMKDGCVGLNRVTSGAPVVPDAALGFFHFSVGQSSYEANVDVAAA